MQKWNEKKKGQSERNRQILNENSASIFHATKNHKTKTKTVENAAHNTKYLPILLCTVFLLCTFFFCIYVYTYIFKHCAGLPFPAYTEKYVHIYMSIYIYIYICTHVYIYRDIWYTLHALFNVSCFRFSYVVAVLLIATRVPFSWWCVCVCVCMFPHYFPNCILLYFCMLDIFVFVFSFINAN